MMLQKYGIQSPKGQDCRACFQLRFCSGKHRPEDNKPFFLPDAAATVCCACVLAGLSAVTGNVGLGVSFPYNDWLGSLADALATAGTGVLSGLSFRPANGIGVLVTMNATMTAITRPVINPMMKPKTIPLFCFFEVAISSSHFDGGRNT